MIMDIEIKSSGKKIKRAALIILAVVAVAAVAILAVSSYNTRSVYADANGITIGEVTEGDFQDYVRLNGKVETGVIVQVSALETGIVEEKLKEEGAMVEAGDIIVTLHNPNLQQQILDSESQLAERQNMLRDTEIAMEKDRLQIKQDLLTARTELNRQQREAERQKTLWDEHLTSREEYLKAQEDWELAKENLSLLISRQHQDSAYRSLQVAMMHESLDNMLQNLALVRSRADNLNIRASHSGQLGSLSVQLGQNVQSGQQIGQINILDNYKIAVDIDEHYIDRISPGLSASASRQQQSFPLIVAKVYPEVNGGKFRADLAMDSAEGKNLRVGQTYSIDIRLDEPHRALMVPKGSFFQTSAGKYAFVLDSDGKTAHRREIRIGLQNPRYYEVLEGLSPGEKIITSSYTDFEKANTVVIR